MIGIWCEQNNANTHPGKTKELWCYLNNREVKHEMPLVNISGAAIKKEPTMNDLGVIFEISL